MIIAVDFDGTLHDGERYPDIGNPRKGLINALISMRSRGHKVILWSCREGRLLTDAVMFCNEHGLHFDAINDNLPMINEKYGNDSRKVYADVYIDNKSKTVFDFLQEFRQKEILRSAKEKAVTRKARIL